MKNVLWLVSLMMALNCMAQQQIPAKMVSVNTNNFSHLPTTTNLQGILNFIDTNLMTSIVTTNYAPRATTNASPTLLTPRWIADYQMIYGTNVNQMQLWQSWGVTTSSWVMIYPVTCLMTTNWQTFTNTTPPRYQGDKAICYQTSNIIWQSFSGTSVTNWRLIYAGPP